MVKVIVHTTNMDQDNNMAIKPINASLIPGVSINKRTLKVAKSKHESIFVIQKGPNRTDAHNRRLDVLKGKLDKVKADFKARNLKFSAHEFALAAIEKAVDDLGAYLGYDPNPKA